MVVESTEADIGAPFVDAVRILHDRPGSEDTPIVPAELSAVSLWPSFERANAIVEVGQPSRLGIALRYRTPVVEQVASHRVWSGDVVLGDHPGRPTAVGTHGGDTGPPAELVDDPGQPIAVIAMNLAQPRLVPVEKLSCGRKLSPHVTIFGRHRQ
jgi:hypothetical protein